MLDKPLDPAYTTNVKGRLSTGTPHTVSQLLHLSPFIKKVSSVLIKALIHCQHAAFAQFLQPVRRSKRPDYLRPHAEKLLVSCKLPQIWNQPCIGEFFL
jgi:hypothetical protein